MNASSCENPFYMSHLMPTTVNLFRFQLIELFASDSLRRASLLPLVIYARRDFLNLSVLMVQKNTKIRRLKVNGQDPLKFYIVGCINSFAMSKLAPHSLESF
jgi:hypothetical protein